MAKSLNGWMGMPRPVMTCNMPTADRRAFIPLAVVRFLAQDDASRELLVLDGRDDVADLMRDDLRARYVRLDHRLTLVTKRNLACDMALGDLIVHWDDDCVHGATLSYRKSFCADGEYDGSRKVPSDAVFRAAPATST
jgi:glycosyltransferase involved in cell wall biosynthesis